MISATQYPTPVGPLSVLARDLEAGGVIVAAGFCPIDELWERLPNRADLKLEPVDSLGPLDGPISAYLDGDLDAIESVAIEQPGTELQQAVWKGLRAIPAGETKTYGQLAEAAGRTKAVRAVGTACGRNLIAPFVPCHRAVRSDGSLGGYLYGLDVKRWLLAHEGSTTQPALDLATP